MSEEVRIGIQGVIKYPYLYAWDRMMGSFHYYIKENQERAEREGAPTDAIYRAATGWVTTREITSEETMQRLQKIHDQYFPDPS